jgi:hypothetical protein
MEKALSILKLIGQDKETINSFVDTLEMELQDGWIDSIWMHGTLTHLIKSLTKLKDINADGLEIDGNQYSQDGYKFTKKEAGARYDFTKCNHPKWSDYYNQSKELSEKQKAIEATLKTLQSKQIIVDEETGEAFEVYPPTKSSKTIIEVR